MQELITNWSKIVAGIVVLAITYAYVNGHASEHALDAVIGILVASQAIHAGTMGLWRK